MASTLTKAQQILFKHGLQESLNKMRTSGNSAYKTAIPGAFYLTNDTHRLYIGDDNGLPVPVNEGIITYANLAAAQSAITHAEANAGQFIFLTQEGILAVSNGKEWVQINNNTDTLYKFESEVAEKTAGTVTVTGTLSGAEKDHPDDWEAAGTLTFSITGQNGVTIDLTEKTVKVIGPDIISKVTTSTGYTNSKAEIALVDDGVTDITKAKSKVTVKGSANVNITEDSSKNIVIEAIDTKLDDVTDRNYAATPGAAGAAAKEGFQVVVKDTSDASSGGKIDPIITLGDGQHHFQSWTDGDGTKHYGEMVLPVYTKTEVDNKVKNFNAMTYKGTFPTASVSQIGSLKNVQNGDTYKANADLSTGVNGIVAKTGDLIIAVGTENANGYIENPTWEVVPSGNEDTQYAFKVISGGIQLMPTEGEEHAGELKFTEGAKINVTQSPTSGNSTTINVAHETTTRQSQTTVTTDEPQSGTDNKFVVSNITINSIDAAADNNGITTDTTGHVTMVTEKIWKFKDTNAVMHSMGVKAEASANVATIKLTPAIKRSNDDVSSAEGNLYLKSTNANLAVTADSNNVELNLVWGTF